MQAPLTKKSNQAGSTIFTQAAMQTFSFNNNNNNFSSSTGTFGVGKGMIIPVSSTAPNLARK